MTSTESQIYQSYEKPGKSTSQVFWLRIMHEIIRPRFLKVKQKQQSICMQMQTFEKYYECCTYQNQRLEQDTIEMQFFARKFDTCIRQGHKALYPGKRVQDICSNKIINKIKLETKIRRQNDKKQKISEIPTNEVVNDLSFHNRKLSWQQQKSITKSELIK